ncbi:hypothetical protein [Nocardioides panaciterrulae]|uniref:Uncharacterized protein n=1 Tax=Nocardioides panaciterrulae TaxID=661492 RepID=A0A7Y9E7P0_9ACTN|nr:hypothetical protein [Nocardioides panaciterrulae]NYD42724.1 hypothetical protein [Nocardioides panaciterrulae]
MTWKSFHRRGEILRAVLATVDQRRDGLLPMDLDGVAETFGDETALLAALQLRWHARLAGRIERELMEQPMDLERGVVAAWRTTARELPGLRAVIDHYRAEPVDAAMAEMLARSARKERVLLASMAGRASSADAAAVRVGERIEEAARASYPRGPVTGHRADPAPGLLSRLRAALAA